MLAVSVTVAEAARPRDRFAVSLANWSGFQEATDWVEFDIAFAEEGAANRGSQRHPYYAPLEGNNTKPFGPLFRLGTGVDQLGRDQVTGPGIAEHGRVWEHRVVGLSSLAPGPLGKHGVVFVGGRPGRQTIYLDNLRIRHADGSTTTLWAGRQDTRQGKVTESDLFGDLEVRVVDVAETLAESR